MLSDEECREIWRTALARCHPTNDISVAGVFAARAAYALGVERARRVKPLVWTEHADHSWGICKEPLCTYYAFDEKAVTRLTTNGDRTHIKTKSRDEAKSACQAHYTALVLSQLEDA